MIRMTAFALLSLVTLAAQAQAPGDMQNMMQGMQGMASCMENIDPAEMERIGKEGDQMHAEVKALCAEGKRDEAQAKALEYGMKIENDPTAKAVAECGKQMQGMMSQSSMPTPEELQNRHVCDDL